MAPPNRKKTFKNRRGNPRASYNIDDSRSGFLSRSQESQGTATVLSDLAMPNSRGNPLPLPMRLNTHIRFDDSSPERRQKPQAAKLKDNVSMPTSRSNPLPQNTHTRFDDSSPGGGGGQRQKPQVPKLKDDVPRRPANPVLTVDPSNHPGNPANAPNAQQKRAEALNKFLDSAKKTPQNTGKVEESVAPGISMESMQDNIPRKRPGSPSDSSTSQKDKKQTKNKKQRIYKKSVEKDTIDLLEDDDENDQTSTPPPNASQAESVAASSRAGEALGLDRKQPTRSSSFWANRRSHRPKTPPQPRDTKAIDVDQDDDMKDGRQTGAMAKKCKKCLDQIGDDVFPPATQSSRETPIHLDDDEEEEKKHPPKVKFTKVNNPSKKSGETTSRFWNYAVDVTKNAVDVVTKNAFGRQSSSEKKKRKGMPIEKPGTSLKANKKASSEDSRRSKRYKNNGVRPFSFEDSHSESSASMEGSRLSKRYKDSGVKSFISVDNHFGSTTTTAASCRTSARFKKKKSPGGEEEPIEIQDDTDDEDEGSQQPKQSEYDAARISIGEAVATSDCKVVFNRETCSLKVSCRIHKKTRTRRSSFGETRQFDIDLLRDITEMAYFRADDDEDCADDMSFLSLSPSGKLATTFDSISKSIVPLSRDSLKKGLVVIEFREDTDLDKIVQDFSESAEVLGKETPLNKVEDKMLAREYCDVLLRNIAIKTTSDSPRKQKSKFLAGKKEEDILLIYPFAGDPETMESAAEGLNEVKDNPVSKKSSLPVVDKETEKGSGRGHFLTIQVSDYERLEPEEYLNDTLIDFWMKWISRSDRSDIHIFSTHFYSTLVEKGVAGVKNWTEKKGIDVFQKKLLFFPINKNLHWSLAVAVNPGCIKGQKGLDEDPNNCILFFDSLKAHSKLAVGRNIRKWLNAEWKRLKCPEEGRKNAPFTETNMEVIAPRVPYQDNGWDCGVFVCRYAYALYQLRKEPFSMEQCYNSRDQIDLRKLITNNTVFQFYGKDIERIRDEIRTLIENLHATYSSWKTAKIRDEKESKKNSNGTKKRSQRAQESTSLEESNNPSLLASGGDLASLGTKQDDEQSVTEIEAPEATKTTESMQSVEEKPQSQVALTLDEKPCEEPEIDETEYAKAAPPLDLTGPQPRGEIRSKFSPVSSLASGSSPWRNGRDLENEPVDSSVEVIEDEFQKKVSLGTSDDMQENEAENEDALVETAYSFATQPPEKGRESASNSQFSQSSGEVALVACQPGQVVDLCETEKLGSNQEQHSPGDTAGGDEGHATSSPFGRSSFEQHSSIYNGGGSPDDSDETSAEI